MVSAMDKKQILIFIVILMAAFLLRLYFVPVAGYEHDVQFFKIWGQTAAQSGVHNIYNKTWCDYPPAYIYVLKAIGSFYSLFYKDFKEHTYLFALLIKLPAIICDLFISCLIFFLLKKDFPFRSRILLMSAFAFNPVIIFDSVYWGQIESVPTLIGLLSIVMLIRNRVYISWALIALAILIKSQMMILLPIILLITWKKYGFKKVMGGFAAFCVSFFFILSPFLYFHQMGAVMNVFTSSVGRYANVSMNAFNLWWLISKGHGSHFWDGQLIGGLFTLRTIGFILLIAFIAMLLKHLFDGEMNEGSALLSCAFALFAFFMLPTEMHERYILPVYAFLLLATAYDGRLRISYIILSMTGFLNLAATLSWVYPKNVPFIGKMLASHYVGIPISLVNLGILLFFVSMISKNRSSRSERADHRVVKNIH